MAVEPRVRKSAEERREEILEVAVRHFAIGGLHGTSTEAIAREAGISQPYLFRLFRTKKELFLACVDRANAQVRDVFRRAAAAAPEDERLKAMGKAYIEELLPDRHAVLMQMQGYVATVGPRDPGARARLLRAARGRGHRALGRRRRRRLGASSRRACCSTSPQSLDLEAIADESEWAASWCKPARAGRRRTLMLERLARLIDRRRRAVLVVVGRSSCSPPGRSAARSSGCSTRRRLLRPRSRSRSRRATRSSASRGARAAPDALVLVRLGARGRDAGGRPQAGGACARGSARTATSRRSSAPRARAPVAAGLRGPPLGLRAGHLLHGRRRGRGGRRARGAPARASRA